MPTLEKRIEALEKKALIKNHKVLVINDGDPEPSKKELDEAAMIIRVKYE